FRGQCIDLIRAVYRKHFPNPIGKTQTGWIDSGAPTPVGSHFWSYVSAVMTHGFNQRFLACLLVISLLVIGGFASAQALTHESQHAHHQKATHGTVLCSWMCAAGQVLDTSAAPYLIEHSPVAVVDQP